MTHAKTWMPDQTSDIGYSPALKGTDDWLWGNIADRLNNRELRSGTGVNVGADPRDIFADCFYLRVFNSTMGAGSEVVILFNNDHSAEELDTSDNRLIAELRSLSALTWDQLAELLNTTRRSVHNWAAGKTLSSANLTRLSRLVATMKYIDRGVGAQNKELLFAKAQDGATAYDLLVNEQYDDVKLLCGPGLGRVSRKWGAIDNESPELESWSSLRAQTEPWVSAKDSKSSAPKKDSSKHPSGTSQMGRKRMKLRRR